MKNDFSRKRNNTTTNKRKCSLLMLQFESTLVHAIRLRVFLRAPFFPFFFISIDAKLICNFKSDLFQGNEFAKFAFRFIRFLDFHFFLHTRVRTYIPSMRCNWCIRFYDILLFSKSTQTFMYYTVQLQWEQSSARRKKEEEYTWLKCVSRSRLRTGFIDQFTILFTDRN